MTKIILRELALEDLNQLNSWRNDKELVDQLGNNFRYIAKNIDHDWYQNYKQNRDKSIRLAIVCSDSNKYIGNINLTDIHAINASAEFSILIGDSAFRGKGVGTIATYMALAHGFNNLNLHRIYLTVLKSNITALKLYEKIGFKVDGIHREAIFKNGKHVDLVSMSILKHEFS